VRKFQKFSRRSRFGKSSRNDDSSSHDYKKRTCHKCKKPGHYMSDWPLWEKESKKKKYKDDDSDDSKKKKKSSKSSSSKSSKSSSHKKSSSKKARAFIGKEMDSEAESEDNVEEEESEESDSGVASLALATAYVSKSIFNTKEMTSPTLLTKASMTMLPPTASWQKVPRYSNIPPLTLVRMNLMTILSLAIPNLLKLLLNNRRL